MDKITANLVLAAVLMSGCPNDGEPAPALDAGSIPVTIPDAGASLDAGTPADATPDGAREAGSLAEAGPSPDSAVPASDLELERQSIAKLKQCGMYEPSADARAYSIEDELDRCVARCTLAASCEQLEQLICEEDESPVQGCLEACADPPADGFRCPDGSRIAHAALCDLFEDCGGGEDEDNCGQFRCANGESIPAQSARCDWIEDCEDGSDERGCAFSCP